MSTSRWRVMSVVLVASIVAVGCGGGEDAVPSAPPSAMSVPVESVPITRSSLTSTISSEGVPVATRPGGRPTVVLQRLPTSTPVSSVPTTQRPPPPIPTGREYRTVADVIETAERGPRIAFSVNTSLPPQVGFGIPLSSWDWDHVEGEGRAGGTTWTNELVALVGTWDGAGFVLTEPPTPATHAENEERGTPTRGCETSRWADIADGLFMANVGVFDVAHGGYDGFCGLYIEAVVDSPELRAALAPLGDAADVTYMLQPAG